MLCRVCLYFLLFGSIISHLYGAQNRKQQATTISCQEEWVVFKNNCYRKLPNIGELTDFKTWEDSKLECENIGSKLAVFPELKNSQEFEEIANKLHIVEQKVFIGGRSKSRKWEWTDGRLFSDFYNNLGQNEPKFENDFVSMSSGGVWYTQPSARKLAYICQKEPELQDTTLDLVCAQEETCGEGEVCATHASCVLWNEVDFTFPEAQTVKICNREKSGICCVPLKFPSSTPAPCTSTVVSDVSVTLSQPGKSELLTSRLKVKKDESASLECLATGSEEVVGLHWFLADYKKPARVEQTTTSVKSNFEFLVSSDHDKKEIRCEAVNSADTVLASAKATIHLELGLPTTTEKNDYCDIEEQTCRLVSAIEQQNKLLQEQKQRQLTTGEVTKQLENSESVNSNEEETRTTAGNGDV